MVDYERFRNGSKGIRTPIIKEKDDLATIVVDSLIQASKNNNFDFRDRDIVAITEAVVGISEGNYVTVDDVSNDIKRRLNNAEELGIVYPILSRNRFSIILKAIARSAKKSMFYCLFLVMKLGMVF